MTVVSLTMPAIAAKRRNPSVHALILKAPAFRCPRLPTVRTSRGAKPSSLSEFPLVYHKNTLRIGKVERFLSRFWYNHDPGAQRGADGHRCALLVVSRGSYPLPS